MLQIEHIYEFLYKNLFFDQHLSHFPGGVPDEKDDIEWKDLITYCNDHDESSPWILFYDQEPIFDRYLTKYLKLLDILDRKIRVVSSEKSKFSKKYKDFYYFYHGFASLDWYRGYHLLNYNKKIVRSYSKDYISFNRLILNDRSYRIFLVSQLIATGILDKGAVSFSVSDEDQSWRMEIGDKDSRMSDYAKKQSIINLSGKNITKLVLDRDSIRSDKSADILRPVTGYTHYGSFHDVDAFWHVVTETVFYHDKLHLTEKIFKPIVSKQPFMLLAAPGNLAYLRSYGFKTFAGIIDESYDDIKDNDARIEAVVSQLKWYCDLSDSEKTEIQKRCESIVEHNFHHFYGKFKEIITDELLDNTKKLFKDIGYDDANVDYVTVRTLLIS